MARRDSFPSLRRMACVFALTVLAASTAMRAEDTKADNLSCDGGPIAVADRQYQQQAGDVLDPRHIEIARSFTGTGSLHVSVCNGQLRVRTRPDAKDLRISVDLGDRADKPAVDYIHILRVAPDDGVIHFKFPNDSHAVVTLTVPMNKGLESQFNVGKGDLNFDAIGSAGERQINVGYGHAKLLLEGDKSYSDMQVNIGMGSLHDHRPGGHDGHFVVSKSYSGSGVGSLQVNVGMGSLDIAQE
jgi:hypothetical protein